MPTPNFIVRDKINSKKNCQEMYVALQHIYSRQWMEWNSTHLVLPASNECNEHRQHLSLKSWWRKHLPGTHSLYQTL